MTITDYSATLRRVFTIGAARGAGGGILGALPTSRTGLHRPMGSDDFRTRFGFVASHGSVRAF